MEDFLVFGKTIADPWSRVCSLQKPVLLMVEFCQIQGPRPLLWHPADVSPHFLADISVWLMSSENQHGNFSFLFNQQMAVFVLVQYAFFIDITARALQRPFALALILNHQPTPEQLIHFQQNATETILPLLACNRFYNNSTLNFAAQLVEKSDETNFKSFYSTSGNAQQIVILSSKIKRIVQQLKPWYDGFLRRVYANEGRSFGCNCECTEEEFRKFAHILSRKQAAQLTDLLELAPCVGKEYAKTLTNCYQQWSSNDVSSEGLMFSGNLPVMRSFRGANSQQPSEDDAEEESSREDSPINLSRYLVGAENTLRTLSFRLTRCIFPLLAGEKIVFLASQQRNVTGIDLMKKLNKLRICKRVESVDWTFDQKGLDKFTTDHQLMGISCDRQKSLSLSDQSADHEFVVIDLNNQRIRCRKYSGKLLANLAGNRNFPSDKASMDFVTSVITDIFQLLLLTKYLSPESVVRHLRLTLQDTQILYNFLIEFNLTKYIGLKTMCREIQRKLPFELQRF